MPHASQPRSPFNGSSRRTTARPSLQPCARPSRAWRGPSSTSSTARRNRSHPERERDIAIRTKVSRLILTLTLAIVATGMFAGSAFAAGPYITIYEDSNQNGDFVTDNGTDYAGLDNLTTAAGRWHDGGCHGAYWPITYTHWNNCISSWRSEERRVGKECRSRWSTYQYRTD